MALEMALAEDILNVVGEEDIHFVDEAMHAFFLVDKNLTDIRNKFDEFACNSDRESLP